MAVDQATGTVAVSFYDGRYDAARSRVAEYLATSIDGGASWAGSETFLNPANVVTDEATGQKVNLGPIPDNESAGNPNQEKTFGFGDREGLVVFGGKVYAAWSSNLNGGTDPTPANLNLLSIRIAQATIGAGPRVTVGTSGPVGLPGDTVNGTRNPVDGGPQAHAFQVTFDRPVDPATATNFANYVVKGFDQNGNPLPAISITGVTVLSSTAYGVTSVQVNFTPQSHPGTYAYTVGPNISDRIRTLVATGTNTTLNGNLMDQNADATHSPTLDLFEQPATQSGTPNFTAPFVTSSLPLIVPGPHVVSTNMQGQTGDQGSSDNLILNSTASYINVVFDRDMSDASFTPAQVLQIMGPAGLVTAPQTFSSGVVNQGIPVTGMVSTPLNVPILIPSDNGSFPIQKLTVQVNITHPSDGNLSAWLVAPDGTMVQLFAAGSGLTGQNFTGTVFDDSATTPIASGTAPYSGTYKPASPLSALNGKDLAPDSTHGTWTLRLVDNRMSGSPGVLVSWSMTATPALTVTPKNDGTEAGTSRTFQVGFPQQQLSGTYTLALAPTISSQVGNYQLDTNLNAGLDALRGVSSTGQTVSVNYATNTPVTIAPMTTATSSITINDNYQIQGETLGLDMLAKYDPDITAVLIPPAALNLAPITLFSGVGATGTQSNFNSTVLDDSAVTSIDNGGAAVLRPVPAGEPAQRVERAVVGGGVDAPDHEHAGDGGGRHRHPPGLEPDVPEAGPGHRAGRAGRRPGVGELPDLHDGPDQPAGRATPGRPSGRPRIGTSGRVGPDRRDRGRPVGPVGQHRLRRRRQRRRLEDDRLPRPPTQRPDLHPADRLRPDLRDQHRRHRRLRPEQRPATSRSSSPPPARATPARTGVGVLRSMDGGATWTLLDSTVNVDSAGNTLPLNSPLRDHAFVGTRHVQDRRRPQPDARPAT